MPRAKSARTPALTAEAVSKNVVSLALEIEEPLSDVSDFVGAGRRRRPCCRGHGLCSICPGRRPARLASCRQISAVQ